jgi:hypothetical protein
MLRCENIVLLTVRFLDVAKVTTQTPLSLLISWKLSFPVVGFKIYILSMLALKFHIHAKLQDRLISYNLIFMCLESTRELSIS